MPDDRLDAALAAQGLARSRTHAARLIADGLVSVDGSPQIKPSLRVRPDAVLTVAAPDHYVSRAAQKLLTALDGFGVDPAGLLVLDVGASTGGFTQVLLERGADRVIALDVGHGQLAPLLRFDPRVSVVEGFNARSMTAESLAAASGVSGTPSLVVADLSFISLTTVLPAVRASVDPAADFVVLVKPQFEVGKGGVREGIVRSGALRVEAVTGVLWAAWDLGLRTAGVLPSPILGTNGNHEYVVHLSPAAGTDPGRWMALVTELASAG